MSDFWSTIARVWSATSWSWIVLWLGLTALVIALFVLMRTRWGQSRPLGKCAVLSLLCHLLLAVYATTVQIVAASAGPGPRDAIRVGFVDADDTSSDQKLGAGDETAKPWNQFAAENTELPDAGSPGRADTALPSFASAAPADDATAEASQTVDLAPPTPRAIAQSTLRGNAHSSAAPAETIEAPTAKSNDSSEDASPDLIAADRVAPPSPRNTGDDVNNDAARSDAVNELTDPLTALPTDVAIRPGDAAIFRGSKSPTRIAGTPDPRAGNQIASSGSSNTGTAATTPAANPLLRPIATGAGIGDATGTPPPLYGDRTSENRGAVIRARGGSPEAEASVQAALKWLSANQSADGRWESARHGGGREMHVLGQDREGAGAKADTAMTGLALLALLGAGNTHLDGKYKDNVKRGLEYVLNEQAIDGNLGGNSEKFAFMYSHGIATLALSEAYAMTRDRRLLAPLKAAIGYTVSAQNPRTGGWRYKPYQLNPTDEGDTSQLGWQLMALKSAELAGIPIPDTTRSGMHRFLANVSSGDHGGLAAYRPRERASRPMTAEALVCRQFLGLGRENPAGNEAGDYLLSELPSGDRINLYYWYYATLGMYQLQGEHWRQWNTALTKTLIERQNTAGKLAGSWDPDCVWAGYGGRVYSTAMAALSLEVYYRYLPLYGDLGPVEREARK